jgi:hypothetical protein
VFDSATNQRALRQGGADARGSGSTSALSPEQVLSKPTVVSMQSRDFYLNEALRDGVTPGDLADVTKEELYRENEVLCTRPPRHTCFHAPRQDAWSERERASERASEQESERELHNGSEDTHWYTAKDCTQVRRCG